MDTELQIVISAINDASGQLSEVGAQLTGLGTQAGEAAEQISSSLTAAEEAAADAAIATATQWDEFVGRGFNRCFRGGNDGQLVIRINQRICPRHCKQHGRRLASKHGGTPRDDGPG